MKVLLTTVCRVFEHGSMVDSILNTLLDFSPADGQRLWPWLVGPTGSGKTTRVRQWAESRGLPVFTLLLRSMLPEEILGIPQVTEGVTKWSLPEWAAPLVDKPGVLFLDELDKARPECLAAILTLLAELRVRDIRLHPGTLVIAASQPVADWDVEDETYRALRARLVPIPVSYDWEFLNHKYGWDLSQFPSNEPTAPAALEIPSMRQVQFCIELILWRDDDVTRRIVSLVIGDAWAARLLRGVRVSPESIARGLAARSGDVYDIPPHVLIDALPHILIHGTPEILSDALVRIFATCSPDDCERALARMYDTLRPQVEAAGVEGFPIFRAAPDATVADWERELDRAVRQIAHCWGATLPEELRAGLRPPEMYTRGFAGQTGGTKLDGERR